MSQPGPAGHVGPVHRAETAEQVLVDPGPDVVQAGHPVGRRGDPRRRPMGARPPLLDGALEDAVLGPAGQFGLLESHEVDVGGDGREHGKERRRTTGNGHPGRLGKDRGYARPPSAIPVRHDASPRGLQRRRSPLGRGAGRGGARRALRPARRQRAGPHGRNVRPAGRVLSSLHGPVGDPEPVAASACAAVGPALGEVKRLWVDPAWRGHGAWAARLMDGPGGGGARPRPVGTSSSATGERQPEAVAPLRIDRVGAGTPSTPTGARFRPGTIRFCKAPRLNSVSPRPQPATRSRSSARSSPPTTPDLKRVRHQIGVLSQIATASSSPTTTSGGPPSRASPSPTRWKRWAGAASPASTPATGTSSDSGATSSRRRHTAWTSSFSCTATSRRRAPARAS